MILVKNNQDEIRTLTSDAEWHAMANDGYHQLQHKSRSENDDGHGGIGIFINERHSYTQRGDLTVFIPHIFESIFVEVINTNSKNTIIGVIYRPNTLPYADLDIFVDALTEIINVISNENKTIYLMGDFNIDLLKFGTHKKNNDFIDSIVTQGLLPHISRPTRIGNNSAMLIDHIYSNDCTRRTESGIILTDISDHFGIFHIVKEKFKYQHPGNAAYCIRQLCEYLQKCIRYCISY